MVKNCEICGGVKTLYKRNYNDREYIYWNCLPCKAEKARNVRKDLKKKKQRLLDFKRIDLMRSDELNLSIKEFVREVERKRFYVDIIDCYRLISLYVDKFGIKYYDHLSQEDELCLMWEELKSVE